LATTNKLITGFAPGSRYRHGTLSALDSSAVVTEFIDTGVTTAGDYVNQANIGHQQFGAGGPPLRTVDVIGLGGGKAVQVKRYNRKHTQLDVESYVTVGQTSLSLMHDADGNRHIIQDPNDPTNPKKRTAQRFIHRISTDDISWKSTASTDPLTPALAALKDTVNNGNYAIDNRTYPPHTLRFRGYNVTHLKAGGIDQWVGEFRASFSPRGWIREELNSAGQIIPINLFKPVTWPQIP
jgi:hypothetical protein